MRLCFVFPSSVSDKEPYWIGENIGFLAPGEDLSWTDGSESDPDVFSAQYAEDATTTDNVCVSMDNNGVWYKEACDVTRGGFVCKRKGGGEMTGDTFCI